MMMLLCISTIRIAIELRKLLYTLSGETYKEWYYLYDENGNLTAKGNEVTGNREDSLSLVKDTVSSRYWEYEYTADNRLKAAYYKGELKAEYSYDADGKRIVSDTGEGTISFVFSFSGQALYEEKVTTDDNTSKTTATSFIYALSKQIARVEGVIGGDGEIIYYHHDNLGSTRLMTDEQGEVVFDQEYLPFGGDLAVVGDIEPRDEVGESYKYTGQREEVAVGLYYYGARFYDPELGRFISEDTYVGVLDNPQSQNIYVYVTNNPMKYIDPTGHFKENPITKSLKSFGEIGSAFWSAALNRSEHQFDSTYDFFNYWSIGMLDATWSGLMERNEHKFNSAYGFFNYASMGTLETFNGAFNPDDPFSAEHWANSFGAAAMVAGGVKYANSSGLTTKLTNKVSKMMEPKWLDDFDNSFKFVDGAKANGVLDDIVKETGEINLLQAPQGTNPWVNGGDIVSMKAPNNYIINMAMAKNQTRPGGWGTLDEIPDVNYVRNNLAVTPEFKPEVSKVQQYLVPEGTQIQVGAVGPQIYNGITYPGGGNQVQILNYSDREKLIPLGDYINIE